MPRCKNIQFDRVGGNVMIIGDDHTVYMAGERVAKKLLASSARDLTLVLECEFAADGYICTGFTTPREPQAAVGAESDPAADESASEGRELARFKVKAQPPVERRRMLDRYGVGIERILNTNATNANKVELWVYPVLRSGAMSPIGTKITRPTKAFLDEVNRVLGTTYYVAQFLPPVDDGMPF